MILIQQRYTSPDPRREAELQRVREANAVAGLFDHVELVDPGASRLSFSDFFRLAAERFSGRTCVIANSDIAFDASIGMADSILAAAGPLLVALTRWDDEVAPSMEGRVDPDSWTFYSHSQDAWVFVAGRLPPFESGFRLGIPACENRLAYEAAAAGIAVVNPALAIRCRHHHASAVRTWTERDAYRGPLLFPRLTTADVGDRAALVVDRTGWRPRKWAVRQVGDFAAEVREGGRRSPTRKN
ncbi:MAG: hypothetical protein K8S94_13825 [Planctomycetia bacterium]|nr:hypothetical protein [Planctomycetia bacterium]